MIKHINMIPVESSSIDSIGYDQEAQELYVKFKKGEVTYIYKDVSLEEWEYMHDESTRSIIFKRIKIEKEYIKSE